MGSKDGCPHIKEMERQYIWCCYMYNKMVSLKDCSKCKYGKGINIVKGGKNT